MNILMLNYEYPPLGGGGGVIHQQLATELAKDFNITVMTSQFRDQKAHEVQDNVEVIRVPIMMRKQSNSASLISVLAFYPSSLWAGYTLLRKRPFDIVHSMFAVPSGVSGLQLARLFRLPHIVSILGGDIYDPTRRVSPHKTPIVHGAVKNVLRRSDRIIGMSQDIVDRANQYFGPFDGRMELIPHAIKRPIFEPRSREVFGFKDNDILLVTVGRLIPRKGVEDLIRVVQRLDRVKLLVIGGGPEKEGLQRLASELQVSSRVSFWGHVTDDEKYQLLSLSDIYVSCARHEGFGLVFLEALACGLPVVCYDNGGQTDFLREGQTGSVVPLENLDLFTAKVNALCQAPELRQRIGQFNLEHVRNYYIEACADRYRTLYHSLLEATRAQQCAATTA
jgi:glycosyltransferase involved in cell wall biosynthesis